MNTKFILAVLIFLFIISGTFLVRTTQENYVQPIPDNITPSVILDTIPETPTTPNPPSTPGTISTLTLSEHNTENDCWVVYNGKVYDVTSYLTRHPGGSNKISRYCGTTDFEQAFLRQHSTSKASLLVNVAVFIGDFSGQGVLGN